MQLVVEDLGLSWFRLRLPAPPTFFDELESEAILAGQSLRFPAFCQAEMYRTHARRHSGSTPLPETCRSRT